MRLLPPSTEPADSGTELTQVSTDPQKGSSLAPGIAVVGMETFSDAMERVARSRSADKNVALAAFAVAHTRDLENELELVGVELREERTKRHAGDVEIARISEGLQHAQESNRTRERLLALAGVTGGAGVSLLASMVWLGAGFLTVAVIILLIGEGSRRAPK